MIPIDAKKIIIEVYDAQDSESAYKDLDKDDLDSTDRSEFEADEDKILYTKIGKTEIPIDKVLSNLLTIEVNNDVKFIIYRNIQLKEISFIKRWMMIS